MTNGAPHGSAGSRRQTIYEHPANTIDHTPVLRALLVALDRWITDGVEPPLSEYPRIDKAELITAEAHKKHFPKIPGMRHPGRNLKPPRVNYGEKFWHEGIFTVVPPEMGKPYQTLVPNFDSDGNGIGGIRLPVLQAPLGTYQGWNPRKTEIGAPDFLARFAGSFWAFPLTEEERERTGDPRPSVESRYPTKADYVQEVTYAVKSLMEQGFLLEEDAEIIISNAERMAWPPEQTMSYPFWKLEE